MAVNFYSETHFADNVGIGQTSPQALLHLTTAMSSSPTTQLYLDVDGSNTNGGGGEIIFNTSATGGSPTNYNAKITGTRASGGTGGDSQLGFWTTLVSSSANPQERMTITKEGNVGIGTTSPNALLDVDNRIYLQNDGTVKWGVSANAGHLTWDTNQAIVKGLSGQALLLGSNNNSARMVIDTSGNVGIGTSSPNARLHVNGEFIVAEDSEKGLDINTQTYNYKIGDIDAGESQTYIEVDSVNAKTTLHNSTLELGHASDTTIARASAGKVTIEGQPIQTKQMSMTHHNFFMNSSSTSADFFIPFNNLNESSNPTNSIYYGRMVAPYDGRIVKVVLNTTAAIGTSCQVLFWIANSISGVFAPSASETVTGVNLNTANSHAVATFSTNSTAEFNEGDVLGVSIIKSSSSTANMQVTVVWEYTV